MKKYGTTIKFGLLTAVMLIIYFLFLGVIGVNTNPVYSFVNAALCAVGISFAIREKQEKLGERATYSKTFTTGVATGIIATIIFTIFFISYYSADKNFAAELQEHALGMNTGLLFLTVITMGAASSVVVTFAMMQAFKGKLAYKKNNSTP